MKNRILSILLTIILSFSLVACNQSSDEKKDKNDKQKTESSDRDDKDDKDESKELSICPKCGELQPRGMNYCQVCGGKIPYVLN